MYEIIFCIHFKLLFMQLYIITDLFSAGVCYINWYVYLFTVLKCLAYTLHVSSKKTPMETLWYFNKHEPILIILSVIFWYELWKKLLYKLPHSLNSVSTLPCKIWMFSCTTLLQRYLVVQFKSVQNCICTVNIYQITRSRLYIYVD